LTGALPYELSSVSSRSPPGVATSAGMAGPHPWNRWATCVATEGPLGLEQGGHIDWNRRATCVGIRSGQTRIEKKLAAKHLEEGELVLWDATAVRFDSQTSELAQFGRPKRGGRSERQLVFGLLTTREGVPVAVEVFPGNTGDPSTVGPVLDRIQERFGLRKMTVVGDRGMLTQTRITDELQPRGLDWITSLRAPTIRKLHEEGPLQLSLFDERDLAEITSPECPSQNP
jgi:hypothetical protein